MRGVVLAEVLLHQSDVTALIMSRLPGNHIITCTTFRMIWTIFRPGWEKKKWHIDEGRTGYTIRGSAVCNVGAECTIHRTILHNYISEWRVSYHNGPVLVPVCMWAACFTSIIRHLFHMRKLTVTPPVFPDDNRPINDSNNHTAVDLNLITQQRTLSHTHTHRDPKKNSSILLLLLLLIRLFARIPSQITARASFRPEELKLLVGVESTCACVSTCEMRQAIPKKT